MAERFAVNSPLPRDESMTYVKTAPVHFPVLMDPLPLCPLAAALCWKFSRISPSNRFSPLPTFSVKNNNKQNCSVTIIGKKLNTKINENHCRQQTEHVSKVINSNWIILKIILNNFENTFYKPNQKTAVVGRRKTRFFFPRLPFSIFSI